MHALKLQLTKKMLGNLMELKIHHILTLKPQTPHATVIARLSEMPQLTNHGALMPPTNSKVEKLITLKKILK